MTATTASKSPKGGTEKRLRAAHTVQIVEELTYRRGYDWHQLPDIVGMLQKIARNPAEDDDMRHRANVLLIGFETPVP